MSGMKACLKRRRKDFGNVFETRVWMVGGFGLDSGEKNMMQDDSVNENRGKQIAVGAVILFLVFGGVACLLLFWRYIPGVVGESVGTFVGVISTPFFLEASFMMLGFMIVVLLNSWRRRKAGDDFVEFDERDFLADQKQRIKDRG
jgi:hypothetical protein